MRWRGRSVSGTGRPHDLPVMTRRSMLALLAAGSAGCRSSTRTDEPAIPRLLLPYIPRETRQVVLVLSDRPESVSARLWQMERERGGDWRRVSEGIPVSPGRSGLVWSVGLHRVPAPEGFRVKREGDGCSPAGVFRLPWAFGYGATGPTRLPWRQCTPTLREVDDPASRFYNQVVEESVPGRDWKSAEVMLRTDDLYRLGVFVDHNPARVPGGGSCIFLHVHPSPGARTAGCTAMAAADLERILGWLDPQAHPVLVQAVQP